MAQRIKSKSIWENRGKSQKQSLKRVEKKYNVRPLLLIACEGEQTEPNYLRGYLSDLIWEKVISSRSYIIVPHGHTDPVGVLNDLLNYRKDGLIASDFERKWIFIDRDEVRTNESSGHTQESFNAAIDLGVKNNVKVAWSNPCFELWFLLHYVYRCTPVDRSEMSDLLTSYMGTEYKKNSFEMYGNLRDLIPCAIGNARKLDEANVSDPCDANPMTTVYKFFEENHRVSLEFF